MTVDGKTSQLTTPVLVLNLCASLEREQSCFQGRCEHGIHLLVRLPWTLLDPFLHDIKQGILSDGFSQMFRAAGS